MARIPLFTGPWDSTAGLSRFNTLINAINDMDFWYTIISVAFQSLIRTVGGSFNVEAPYFVYIIDPTVSATWTAQLPASATWFALYGGAIPVIVKDGKGDASSFNGTMLPFGSETIDGNASYVIAGDRAALAVRPRPDGTGWVVT